MYTLLEMVAGDSTKLYEDLYNEGLLTGELSTEFSSEEDYAFSSISGESKEPEKVVGRILDKIADGIIFSGIFP